MTEVFVKPVIATNWSLTGSVDGSTCRGSSRAQVVQPT